MNPVTVVVVHREAMVAEGLAAALARFPGLLPVAVATTALDGERCGAEVGAVALDERVDDARNAATRLRRTGVRVIFIGEGAEDDQGVTISSSSSITQLASALSPHGQIVPTRSLTTREREVLTLVVRGLAAKQVASRLGISHKTVEQHKTRIFAKLGVTNQTAATAVALSSHLGKQPWNLSNI